MEEAKEFSRDETAEELADLLEVIEAIGQYKNFSSEEILRVRKEKSEKRGKFEKHIILDES